jgi:hypothetical protein
MENTTLMQICIRLSEDKRYVWKRLNKADILKHAFEQNVSSKIFSNNHYNTYSSLKHRLVCTCVLT